MRARFSAYCSKSTDYICNTTHPENSAFGGTMEDGEQSSTFKVRLRVVAHIAHTHDMHCMND